MAPSTSPDRPDAAPDWWSVSALGIGYPLAVTALLVVGSLLVVRGVAALPWTRSSMAAFGSASSMLLAMGLLAALYAVVGLGATAVYLARRDLARGFVLASPSREGWRWVAGLLGLAVALVWGGTLATSLPDGGSPGAVLDVPAAFLAPTVVPMAVQGVDVALFGAVAILVMAGVVGPALGVLYHGVIQTSLRQVVPAGLAVGATAVFLALIAASNGDAVGTLLVAGFAVAAGVAYERTGNLAVPMLGYAALNAFTFGTALVFLLSTTGSL